MLASAPMRRDPINHMPVTQSVIGVALPLVFGTARVSGTLLWRGDLQAHAEKAGGKAKGGKNSNTYAYTATFIAALAHGPILGINGIWDQSGMLPLAPADVSFSTLQIPAAPTLSYTPGGSLPQTTYYVTVAYVNPGSTYALSAASAEASITVPAGNLLVVDSPAASAGSSQWNIYAAATSGDEQIQNAAPIALGTNWTMPTGGLISGVPHPQHHHVVPRSPDPSGDVKGDLGLIGTGGANLVRKPYTLI